MADKSNKSDAFAPNISQTASELTQLLSNKNKETFTYSKLKILYPYIKKYPSLVITVIITSIISGVILLPIPFLIKFIVDKYIVELNLKMIIVSCIIALSLYIVNLINKTILNYYFSLLNNKFLLALKQDMMNRVISLPLSFFTNKQSGYLVSRINEINQLQAFLSTSIITLIVSGLTFVCSIFILGFLSWELLLLTLLFTPAQFFIVKRLSSAMQKVSKAMMEKSANLNKNMQEVVAGIQTVKSFASEDKERKKINSSMRSVFRSSLNQNIFMGLSQDIINFISSITNISVLFISAFMIIRGHFTIGLYIACLQFVGNILKPVQTFASTGMIIQPMIVAINRICEYLEITGEDSNVSRWKKPNSLQGKIKFEGVSFFYQENNPILRKLSFSINPGEKILIKGANGSGKTTLIKLLLQLHLQQEGTITIDNNDIKNINLTVLRKKIGLVSQDIFLFNDTIMNNMLYGADDVSDKGLDSIIDRFCPFIRCLPNGINTLVGENGNNLSGGQKQAISIVRTILKDVDILVFDEGNTNLDTELKEILIDLVKEYFENKTCIFITHDELKYDGLTRVMTLKDGSIAKNNN